MKPKNPPRELIEISDLGVKFSTDSDHRILKVGISKRFDAEFYAFDIAGAQFGYYDPIGPWSDYLNLRIRRIKVPKTLNSRLCGSSYFAALKKASLPNIDGARARFKHFVSGGMLGVIKRWEEENVPLIDMLLSPECSWVKLREELIELVASDLMLTVESWEDQH